MPTEGYNSGSLFEMKFYFSGSQWVDFRLGLGVVCSEPKRPSRAVFKVSTPGSKTVDVGRCSLGHLVLVASMTGIAWGGLKNDSGCARMRLPMAWRIRYRLVPLTPCEAKATLKAR